ncbi:glucose-6-phosphate dehydrogenase [Sandaracinobacteroides hominis]|uniref:glucose-6-phosphate dehydrogenase n=1 Tax=Sandaracinobacteroides hominis TaxID=2780086 RepID=UPI0018F31C2F|nr:glucose-6-phosphate dehydrogenase [Sandaracinobacteroides hominis]
MTAVILFGATGDLSRRMLLPSLYGLSVDGLLAGDVRIVGTARSQLDDAGFRQMAADAIAPHIANGLGDQAHADKFLQQLAYVPLDATDKSSYSRLTEAACGSTVCDTAQSISIFLSTAPSLFKPTIEGLAAAGLSGPNVRIGLEKPLGTDLASSAEINDAVAAAFSEKQIFRIDHYLGKETVQNLLAMRFANVLFEPLWRSDAIANVQITVAETVGLEGRVDFYDGAGALRDMVQNHMLQLLALVAMEPPSHFTATAVRDEKVKVLNALRPIDSSTAVTHSVTGQYAAGAVNGQPVKGYLEELGRPSNTETFVALKAHVDNWRWKGVPFYLRTGKRLGARKSEILINFKSVPHSIFGEDVRGMHPNSMLIGLQPEENIRLSLMAKVPGLNRGGIRLREVELDIDQADAFADKRRRIAYEQLLLDLIEGRQTLFVRRDEVEAQWAFIDGIRKGWADNNMQPKPYTAGGWGPSAAIALIERDNASWND